MANFIIESIESGGYTAIVILMFVENVFPPIPSEVIIPFSGFVAAQGSLSLIGVIVAGTVGTVLGALPWYALGRWFGERRVRMLAKRFGRVLTLNQSDIDRAKKYFNAHDGTIVFLGRLLPTIRTLISVPAGLARMPMIPFLVLTTLGSFVWTALLATLGFLLESQYERIGAYIDPVTNVIIFMIVIGYVYRVVTYTPEDIDSERI